MLSVGITHYLFVSAFLFCLGLCCAISQRSIFKILMGIVFMFSASALNFAASARLIPHIDGTLAAVFSLTAAASEAAVGICLALMFCRIFKSSDFDKAEETADAVRKE